MLIQLPFIQMCNMTPGNINFQEPLTQKRHKYSKRNFAKNIKVSAYRSTIYNILKGYKATWRVCQWRTAKPFYFYIYKETETSTLTISHLIGQLEWRLNLSQSIIILLAVFAEVELILLSRKYLTYPVLSEAREHQELPPGQCINLDGVTETKCPITGLSKLWKSTKW